MRFTQALGVERGVTAVIGSGGKSSLLDKLASELRAEHRVLLCTTTHMFPASGMRTLAEPDEAAIARVLDAEGAVCVGVPGEDGRLHAPGIPMSRLTALADYVIVEADGSKRLPLKAHASHEPVIPAEAGRTICVVGMSGLGRRVSETVHRPELFAPCDVPVTEELLASVLNREALADVYFLNQCDICGMERARKLAALLDRPSACGSIREGTAVCLW